MKKFIFFILFFNILLSNQVYFLPFDGKKAQNRICNLISHAKNIKIIIYTFTNKNLAKSLKIAAKKGAKIEIIADKKEAHYKKSLIPNLAAIKNINVFLLLGKRYKNNDRAKMHVKMTIIDNKYLILGSANYSYSAFFKNYEYILIVKNKNLIKKFIQFFNKIKLKAKPYRFSQ